MTDLQTPILFLDFDGTISRRDAVDAILETYADPKWLTFESEWQAGRMGSRDCLRAQMSLVRASRKQIDALLDDIGIDEFLVPLLEMCAMQHIPVHIISDGFDYCIRRILSGAGKRVAALLRGGRVCAGHLESRGHLWRTEFSFFHQTCGHGCATCKATRSRAPISSSQKMASPHIAPNNQSSTFHIRISERWLPASIVGWQDECS